MLLCGVGWREKGAVMKKIFFAMLCMLGLLFPVSVKAADSMGDDFTSVDQLLDFFAQSLAICSILCKDEVNDDIEVVREIINRTIPTQEGRDRYNFIFLQKMASRTEEASDAVISRRYYNKPEQLPPEQCERLRQDRREVFNSLKVGSIH